MADQGIDALVLLGNTNVVYATGAIWPLGDAGRANFEQPVAVVLADDEMPAPVHAVPRRRPARALELADDHLHGPMYLDFDEGVAAVRRRSSPTLVPARRDDRGRRVDRRDAPRPRAASSPTGRRERRAR